jgi:hypothetical protein
MKPCESGAFLHPEIRNRTLRGARRDVVAKDRIVLLWVERWFLISGLNILAFYWFLMYFFFNFDRHNNLGFF